MADDTWQNSRDSRWQMADGREPHSVIEDLGLDEGKERRREEKKEKRE